MLRNITTDVVRSTEGAAYRSYDKCSHENMRLAFRCFDGAGAILRLLAVHAKVMHGASPRISDVPEGPSIERSGVVRNAIMLSQSSVEVGNAIRNS